MRLLPALLDRLPIRRRRSTAPSYDGRPEAHRRHLYDAEPTEWGLRFPLAPEDRPAEPSPPPPPPPCRVPAPPRAAAPVESPGARAAVEPHVLPTPLGLLSCAPAPAPPPEPFPRRPGHRR